MKIKRTRNRPTKSCLECNRRKQKCDRKSPCRHCISRGVAGRCIYQEQPKQPINQTSNKKPASHGSEGSESNASDFEESSDLGYTTHGSGALREIEKIASFPPPKARVGRGGSTCLLNRHIIQQSLPHKTVMDLLTRTFFKEINRVYEVVYEPIFWRDYDEWWSKPDNNDSDINKLDFALLMIRICILSTHILAVTDRDITSQNNLLAEYSQSPGKLENNLCCLAADLESKRPQKHSFLVVQHMFFRVCYLKNKGKIKHSWFVLADTVKEAHEIGLHLEDTLTLDMSELDRELRRRLFWSLYVWDRFMCTFLGRWPLIPEDHCDISLPHDSIQAITTTPEVLTHFTDRLYHIHVARFISKTMGSKSWKMDQYDPVVVAQNHARFEKEILCKLPRALSLTMADTSWDVAFPVLAVKREDLHLSLYAAVAGLYRGFTNPWEQNTNSDNVQEEEPSVLVITYFERLITELCNILDSSMRLYEMCQNNPHTEGLFMIPMSMVEALSQIGLCFRAAESQKAAKWAMRNAEWARAINYRLQFDVCKKFGAAYAVLKHQSQNSRIAKQGMLILSELASQIQSFSNSGKSIFANIQSSPTEEGLSFTTGNVAWENMDQVPAFPLDQSTIDDRLFDWVDFATSSDRSWFFDAQAELFA
ncbi:fungal-specific transcription factor domain-containing protein [Talaromyces proteolyticus]|uniref:Fungal-specific transcription factor domain-containing protein n=1 Tax=Talaromyces proteolyticus TaxID=1131652 RepID=A0AAD4KVU1_9EURO|nr:fungal-specific transcription factor domain-containing protein [Talaromyces proteolyticus]KAH8697821.1 fungal-specific transcription factor domain-containing protein [Talaromyces proteolyticus]